MFGKSPVSVVQEYCSKNKLDFPIYETMVNESDKDGQKFVVKIMALDNTCLGVGRSKQDAKHDAARNFIKLMRSQHPGIENIPLADTGSTAGLITDAIVVLRDICVQREHPLPVFELIQQAGPPESPQFTYQCTVGNIVRIGQALTKKMAKQLAAQCMIEIMQAVIFDPYSEEDLQVVPLDKAIEDCHMENRQKYKTYKELTDNDSTEFEKYDGRKFSERHLYFRKFFDQVKENAMHVLRSTDYISEEDKVMDLMKALKLKYKMSSMKMKNLEIHEVFDVVCDIDAIFINKKELIYKEILDYFSGMLF